MSSVEIVDLVKYLAPILLPVLAGLLTLWLSNSHSRQLAQVERAHQEKLANATATQAATERRYEQRLRVVAALVDEATRLRDEALKDEYYGDKGPPSGYLDGPELEDHFRVLRQTLNEALLVGTSATRDAAERVARTTERYVWDWDSDDYTALDQALIDFRAAARKDLGIDGGTPEKAAPKPNRPSRRAAASG
jgi:hypothetical protein